MGTNQPVSDEELLRLLKRAAADLGVRAWVVGGYVRDKLLGRAGEAIVKAINEHTDELKEREQG